MYLLRYDTPAIYTGPELPQLRKDHLFVGRFAAVFVLRESSALARRGAEHDS